LSRAFTWTGSAIACSALLFTTGCKSNWINGHVLNETGQAVRELEVDYPTASFGVNSVASGSELKYRFKVRGSGPVKVQYTAQDGKQCVAQGLTLDEHQTGELTIRLLPNQKVEFLPRLEPAS
jgi:hypothetical protein